VALEKGVSQEVMAELSLDEVEKVAALANLRFTGDEMEKMRGTLAQILGHIDRLTELDTENVPPTSHAHKTENVFREDKTAEPFEKGKMLDNAPAKDRNHFSVPRVIE
jgi:aspartyl-tRNA(Asn)/glutamyl-tRNA(Gln) amidotransferase subunit C